MSKRVFKYEVPVDDDLHVVELNGFILEVGHQRMGYVTFWAEVSEKIPLGDRYFKVYGTGHAIEDGMSYIGTAHDPLLGAVWHLYENTNLAIT